MGGEGTGLGVRGMDGERMRERWGENESWRQGKKEIKEETGGFFEIMDR